jgi:hypothetical protein
VPCSIKFSNKNFPKFDIFLMHAICFSHLNGLNLISFTILFHIYNYLYYFSSIMFTSVDRGLLKNVYEGSF